MHIDLLEGLSFAGSSNFERRYEPAAGGLLGRHDVLDEALARPRQPPSSSSDSGRMPTDTALLSVQVLIHTQRKLIRMCRHLYILH
jgi:hypothetical protein